MSNIMKVSALRMSDGKLVRLDHDATITDGYEVNGKIFPTMKAAKQHLAAERIYEVKQALGNSLSYLIRSAQIEISEHEIDQCVHSIITELDHYPDQLDELAGLLLSFYDAKKECEPAS